MVEAIIPKRYDTVIGRFYEHEGRLIPSVTNVLGTVSKGLGYDKWLGNFSSYDAAMAFAKEAAERGTRVHINCEALIAGLPVSAKGVLPDDEALMLMAFKEWVDKVQPNFIGSEVTMWHPDYPVAGTADIIAEIKGYLYLIDIKTGKHYDNHQLQLTGYGRLYQKIYGKEPKLAVLRLYVGQGKVGKSDVKAYDYHDEGLAAAVNLFKWMHPAKPKPFTPAVIPEIIQLEEKYVKESI